MQQTKNLAILAPSVVSLLKGLVGEQFKHTNT